MRRAGPGRAGLAWSGRETPWRQGQLLRHVRATLSPSLSIEIRPLVTTQNPARYCSSTNSNLIQLTRNCSLWALLAKN